MDARRHLGDQFFMRISSSSFRAFVHPVASMTAAAEREGLTLERRERPGLIWESAVYERRVS